MGDNTMPYERNADMDDLPHTEWKCEKCGAMNSCIDAECQFCDADYDESHGCEPDDYELEMDQENQWFIDSLAE
jgi:hypothetical protein